MAINFIHGPEISIHNFNEGGTNMDNNEDKKFIRDEVDRKVRAYMAGHPEVDYERAMSLVFSLDPALKERYARS